VQERLEEVLGLAQGLALRRPQPLVPAHQIGESLLEGERWENNRLVSELCNVDGLLGGCARSGSEDREKTGRLELCREKLGNHFRVAGLNQNDASHEAEWARGVHHAGSADRCATTDDQNVTQLGGAFSGESGKVRF
jgi:hypothetical protein